MSIFQPKAASRNDRRTLRRRLSVSFAAIGVIVAVAAGATLMIAGAANDVQHGIGLTKGCNSPTQINDPYVCTYAIFNIFDQAHDTLTINSLVDVVHSAGGDVSSLNAFSSLRFEIGAGTPTCNGTGTGTPADPFVNATSCTMPFGAVLNVQPYSFYTVTAADFNLPSHFLPDSATLTWHDLCDDPAATGNTNCNPNPPTVGAASQTLVQQLPSTTTTDIHSSVHTIVTAVEVGATVHDFVTVDGGAGNPPPTGSVTIDWFTNNTCAGSPAVTSASIALGAGGMVDATSFPQGPLAAGLYGFKAHYLGDPANPVYAPSDGACEPLRVVDANIQITPDGTNRVGQTHTFTGHVELDDGSGFVNAPAGTPITFAIDSGPGGFTSSNPCLTVGVTGSCTIDLVSPATGVTKVSASAPVTVSGVALNRTTDGTAGNSGPATKTWVNARILIAPNATNEVGDPHTFTVTLEKDLGDGAGFVAAANEHVDVTLTDSNGATHTAPSGTCTTAGPNTDASGECTITFTSPTGGKVTGHATSSLNVSGVPIVVATDGAAPNSGDAVKTFVDANIQITPPTASNQVGTDHVLTGHVNVNDGTGGFVDAPNGTVIDFSITNGPGSFNGPSSCTVTNGVGSCTATITSPTVGTTVVKATTTVSVGSISLTRATGDAHVGDSANAQKTWVDARITITPDATNEIGNPHTFTVFVEQNDGTGWTPAAAVAITSVLTGAGAITGGTCGPTGPTDVGGQCTVTVNSATPGVAHVNASGTVTVGGVPILVATDGYGAHDIHNQKTWVDANIEITPATADNQVGTNHVLTGHVRVNTGTGGYVDAPDGTTIDFSITNGPGSFVGPASCTVSNGLGTCTVTISSPTVGTTTVQATTTVSVGGVALTRTTGDANVGDSANALKTWVDARISITPNGVNEVNHAHTFTVLVEQNDGTGWAPAAGVGINSVLTGVGAITGGSCAPGVTDANGQCTLIVNSATPGIAHVNASGTVTVNGVPILVATDGYGALLVQNQKTWVDANIQITPPTANNKVDTDHVLTGHVNVNTGTGGYVDAPDGTVIDFAITNGPGSFNGPSSCTVTNGLGSCTVTITSAVLGTTTIKASTDVTVNTVLLHRETGDGLPGDSANAQKTWVDARISIVQHGTNKVGDMHTFTVTVEQNDGTGWSPAAGVTVDSAKTGVGSITGGTCGPTGTTDAAGQCTVNINSPDPGMTTVNASSTVTVGGVPIPVATDGYGAFTVDNVKTWVDARITIHQTGTNQVTHEHTFTVDVEQNDGTNGWLPAVGVTIDSTTTFGTITGGTCGPTGPTNGAGQCTVIVNSNDPGKTTVNASGTVTVGGVDIDVATDGYGAHDISNEKTWVDARITISQSGTNQVGAPHTFTVFVEKNDGTSWSPADGVTIDSTAVGVGSITGGTCGPTGPTNGSGECTVTVTSNVPGSSTVDASGTVTVGGVDILVATDGYGNHDISNVKTWADARITIHTSGTNKVGDPHTFTVQVERNDGTGWTAAAGVDVSSSSAGVGSITGGTCGAPATGPTDANGECTVVVNSNTVGDATVDASATVTVGGVDVDVATDGYGAHDISNVKTWVDARITIFEEGTNQVGDGHTFTVLVEKNDGTGWAAADGVTIDSTATGVGSITGGTCGPTGTTDASGECTVIVNSNTPGTTTVNASGTVLVGGVSIAVATDGYGAHGISNVKTWVDARITISETGTNEVGHAHTFTVLVEKNDGTGWAAADGVTITSTTSFGSITGGTCGPTGPTDATGECTVIVNSTSAGIAQVNASGTVVVGGVSIPVSTTGYGAHDVSNEKTWVDANIQITPASANNQVGTDHVLTGHVNVNDGTGFANAPAGTTITFSITGGPGSFNGPSSCLTVGATGSCTVKITSATTGTTTVKASTDVVVSTVALHRETGDQQAGDSDDASKTWVDARITIAESGTNPVSNAHTFTVFVEQNDGTAWSPAGGVTITSTATGVGSITGGSCGPTGATSGAGTCTVIVNSAVPGTTTVDASGTVTVGGVAILVATNGYGAHDISNVKLWADAAVRTDIHNTDHDVVTSVLTGTSVHDKVFVTKLAGTTASVPSPTGNVVFHRYSTIDCSGQSADQTVTIAADGTAETNAFTATSNMSYEADYLGDENYPARSGACEPLTVTTPPVADDTVRTDIHDTAHGVVTSVASGTSVHDKVFVTRTGSTTASLPNPTGNVVFHRYVTIDCTGAAVDQTVTIAADGTAETSAFTAEAPVGGSAALSYRADYLGNGTYPARSGACEPLTIAGLTPPPTPPPVTVANDTVRTDVHNASHRVITSLTGPATVHDKVFVTRTANTTTSLPAPTGRVIFHRFSNPNCTGPSVNQTVKLGADGTAESRAFKATSEFSYRADYQGDGTYPARNGACEPVTFPGPPPPAIKITKVPVKVNIVPTIKIVKNPPEQNFLINQDNLWVNSSGQLLSNPGMPPAATFTITVTNTSKVTLVKVKVTDPLAQGCNRTIGKMAPGAKVSYKCDRKNVPAVFTNTAKVVGTYVPPKKTTRPFKITVRNTGQVLLRNVKVTNPKQAANCNRTFKVLAPRASRTYKCLQRNVVAPSTTRAVAVGTSPTGSKARSVTTAKVVAPKGRTVMDVDSALVHLRCYRVPCNTG